MMEPKCVCGTPLVPSGKYWKCPRDNFFYNVSRGASGRPMWIQPEEEAVLAPQPVKEETFEGWLAERGVSPEMYKDADDRTKEDLRTAFYQRHLKEGADVVLFPPQR